MSIRAVVTRGYGNGTYNGTITEAVLRGYTIGTASLPVFSGPIPEISETFGAGLLRYDLSTYFTGATSYSISPSVPTGWIFNTTLGVLTIDTNAISTFGPYVVTGTNVSGSAPSNSFSVTVNPIIVAEGVGSIRMGAGTAIPSKSTGTIQNIDGSGKINETSSGGKTR